MSWPEPTPHPQPLSPAGRGEKELPGTGLCAQLACLWETTARNPGNAHRYRDFADATYLDFLASAAAVAPVLDAAPTRPVGRTVLLGVRATRQLVRANTNLGILLLLAPLAAVPRPQTLCEGLPQVLDGLTVDDACAVYEAIRLAAPAGLGRVEDQDVRGRPTQPLRQVMALAADRDWIARQYADGFQAVLHDGVPFLGEAVCRDRSLEPALVRCHLHFMANYPDTLIARKRGVAESVEAARRAGEVLAADWPHAEAGRRSMRELDEWLRAEERGRNPGTTSDLVTASLFAALRDATMTLPSEVPWSVGVSHG